MNVTIDGVLYEPAGQRNPLIGVGITTRNRPQVLERTLKQIEAVTPREIPVFVVDDASDQPNSEADYRFDENVGVSRAKNKCIELLMQAGVDHLVLLDDDTYPVVEKWWEGWVYGPEPHYSYIFTHWANRTPVGDCSCIYDDGQLKAFSHTRGCAVYIHRSVVEKVGGFDPAFGMGMEQDIEYSRRINNAGLTTFAYQDVSDSHTVWHSMDQHQEVRTSLVDRPAQLTRNAPVLAERENACGYIEYRQLDNLVITTLLTSRIDKQRNVKWKADPNLVAAWRNSIGGAQPVVLTDEIDDPPTFLKRTVGWPVYTQRWVTILQYLKTVEAQWVWCTDGTDVRMIRQPWEHMKPGVLYVGDEPVTLSKPWLAEHHPAYREWIEQNPHEQMLNAGLVGGDHGTVVEFLSDLVREITKTHDQCEFEMGALNYVLRSDNWRDRVSHGPHVNNLFKSNQPDSGCNWFQHK